MRDRRLVVAVLALGTGLLSLPRALAQEAEASAAQAVEAPPPQPDGRRTLARLPSNLGRSLVGVFSADNLAPLAIGVAATSIAAAFDNDVKNAIADPENEFGQAAETAGGPGVNSAVVIATFVAGRLAHSPRFRAMSYDMLTGSIVNLGYTELLKIAVGRERPDASDNNSFPSGHTSQAFVLATVAERHYGWKVGVPAYAGAAAMGLSRLQRNRHYLSDVLAGSAVGYIVGRTTVRTSGGRVTPRAVAWSLAPIFSRQSRGMSLRLAF